MKEENGNEIQFKLNQVQAQLINITNEKEQLVNRYNREIEELREKNNKEHSNSQLVQIQLNQKTLECNNILE